MAERFSTSLLAALADLMRWLDALKTPSMIIGGVAASFLGRPRFTKDVDALAILPEADWEKAAKSAAQFGIVPRIGNAIDFARRTRVLLMKHLSSEIEIDVTFGGLPFEQAAVDRSQIHDLEGIQVRLPEVEDLLIMKAVARRPKDLLDIDGLLAAHPQTNVEMVRQWVREFANAMSMSDIADEFDKLLAKRKSSSGGVSHSKSKRRLKSKSKSGRKTKS